jgi:hypothetical protein
MLFVEERGRERRLEISTSSPQPSPPSKAWRRGSFLSRNIFKTISSS